MVFNSYSAEETFEIGKQYGKLAKSGEIYCLIGELGVGKTIFTKGFAEGLGVLEPVTSPTFTIVNVYDEVAVPFYHFDVYRIEHVSEMEEIGYEEFFYGKGVTFIEWANLIEELIPKKSRWIYIEKQLDLGFDYRKIIVKEDV
jgi:tRNA threonylcarbamoyladenosine biosynthesis protein TsaE